MDPLPDVPATLARWLDGAVPALLGLLAGLLGARLIGSRRRHPGAGAAGRGEGLSARTSRRSARHAAKQAADDDALAVAAAAAAEDEAHEAGPRRPQIIEAHEGRDPVSDSPSGMIGKTVGQSRLDEMQALLERLEQENRYLEQALAHRGADIQMLTARMGEAAARDREELVRLQEELEAEHRIGFEKARLIRSLEAASRRAEARLQEVEANRERQRVSVAALQAALAHAKRAQASTERRLARLREQLRIVEVPVERIVYPLRCRWRCRSKCRWDSQYCRRLRPAVCGRGIRRTGRVPRDGSRR